jgi:hypothetical protein
MSPRPSRTMRHAGTGRADGAPTSPGGSALRRSGETPTSPRRARCPHSAAGAPPYQRPGLRRRWRLHGADVLERAIEFDSKYGPGADDRGADGPRVRPTKRLGRQLTAHGTWDDPDPSLDVAQPVGVRWLERVPLGEGLSDDVWVRTDDELRQSILERHPRTHRERVPHSHYRGVPAALCLSPRSRSLEGMAPARTIGSARMGGAGRAPACTRPGSLGVLGSARRPGATQATYRDSRTSTSRST